MKKSIYLLFVLFATFALLLSSCGKTEETTPVPTEEPVEEVVVEEPAADIALKITGMVANEMSWTEAEVKAMEAITVEAANKDGEMKSYTGVSLNALLALAGVAADATGVVFVADDGFTGEVTLADIQACTDCIVSFRDQGGFSIVLPGFPSNVQVKGVVEIQVK